MRQARYRSGPLVWLAVLAATCLQLFLFQKILWLVVPFLFALIIYYLLFPIQRRLVLAGLSRDAASALVSCGAFALAAGAAILVFPWLGTHLASFRVALSAAANRQGSRPRVSEEATRNPLSIGSRKSSWPINSSSPGT